MGHYEKWLEKASISERAGNRKSAIFCLDKAEKHTCDPEELRYLNIWRNRLKREAATSKQP